MRSRISFFALTLVVGSLALPHLAHASIPFFGPIIPASYNVCPASWGLLLTVVNNVIEFLLTLAIVFVAPLMVAYAGFLFVVNPVSSGGKEQARKVLTNTVVGIVIALSGWMIVDAVMVVLYNPGATSGTTRLEAWAGLIRGDASDTCLSQAGSLPTDTLNQAAPTGIMAVPASGNEQAIRQRFENGGVSINNSACASGSSGSGCTNVNGMQEGTVAQVLALASACGSGCSVTITGGTEPGHASGTYSHGSGHKVDLRPTGTLDSYLTSMKSIGTRTGDAPGPAYTDKCGQNVYVRESDHWDITIYASCIPPN